MTADTVAQLRALAASKAAVRQYRRAARLHTEAAAELMAKGWYEYAGESLRLADRLAVAALAEKLGRA